METRKTLQQSKRIVVKVGTSTLTHDNGQMNLSRIERLARELSDLHNEGREVLLVTSGAVATGVGKWAIKNIPRPFP
jgi:glutamate 5-kinase